MPANLPPEYLKVEEQYARAKTLEERIELTRELIRLAPKHKGTEKLLKMLKQRLAKLQRELKEKEKKRAGKSTQAFAIKKEGAAQVVFLGFPNSGKSTLLSKLTAAKPEIADYPFTTLEPVPAMMEIDGVQIQLVEAPGVVEGSSEGRGLGLKPLSLARTADAIGLVLGATDDPVEELNVLLRELERVGIKVNKKPPAVKIEERSSGGIEVVGAHLVSGGEEHVREILQDHGEFNAHVVIWEPVSPAQLRELVGKSVAFKKAFVLVARKDIPDIERKLSALLERFGKDFEIIMVGEEDLEEVKRKIFKSLDLIRVFTKPPDGEPSDRPLVLKKHSTILDVAKAVHKDLARNLKYARVWGSTKFPGQQVSKSYEVRDGDIVELHA